jgi:2'-5' RNA ligase
MRLFVGIALTPEAAEVLRRVRQRFAPESGDLRWSAPENWHVTLQFLGECGAEQAACVTGRLAELRAEPVPIAIGNPGFFERAGVFHAEVLLNPALLALHQKVTAATRTCGFIPETRPCQPHITLARARGRGGPSALAPLQNALRKARFTLAAEFAATEFLLYESFPGPAGSRYEVRARYPLTGG